MGKIYNNKKVIKGSNRYNQAWKIRNLKFNNILRILFDSLQFQPIWKLLIAFEYNKCKSKGDVDAIQIIYCLRNSSVLLSQTSRNILVSIGDILNETLLNTISVILTNIVFKRHSLFTRTWSQIRYLRSWLNMTWI